MIRMRHLKLFANSWLTLGGRGLRAFPAVSVLVAVGVISVPTYAATQPILIFGGADHDEFLGCLNCGGADPASVWKEVVPRYVV